MTHSKGPGAFGKKASGPAMGKAIGRCGGFSEFFRAWCAGRGWDPQCLKGGRWGVSCCSLCATEALSAQNGGGEGRWARSCCPAGGKGCLGRCRSPSRCWPGGWGLRRLGRQSRWRACQGGDRRCRRPASRCFAGWRAVGPVVGRCPTGRFAGWRFAGDPAGCRPVCRFAGWRLVRCFAGRWPVDRFAVS